MMLFWKIRYLDRTDKTFKDRYLYLETETLEPVTRAAIELVTEGKSSRSRREILKYRHLFVEGSLESLPSDPRGWVEFRGVGPSEYFEDEVGTEITILDMGPILTGDPEARFYPGHFRRHDVELRESKKVPLPLEEVSLTPDEVRLLGYLTRDLSELGRSAFMKDGPGTLTISGGGVPPGGSGPVLKTAVTDEEIRSFITIFRRLYMEKEPANFKKAVGVCIRAFGDHPYGKWLASELGEYESRLASGPVMMPIFPTQPLTFTVKRLIDVFIYTQYAHQPSEERQRQFSECLAEVEGKQGLLTWIFLTEIHKCSLTIGNAGRVMAGWFRHYCGHHTVSPDLLNSLRDDLAGLGAEEKEADRQDRLFREKVEELEMELWKRAGRPEGGPVQFRATAREQLRRALRGEGPG